MKLPESKLTKHQKKVFTKNNVNYCGEMTDIIVTVRHDDECGNGRNSFAITADIYKAGKRGDRNFIAGGCCHDEISKHFPEIAPLIKWHLTGTDGPMHYVANTLYHASDKDCWGYRKGEVSRYEMGVKFDDNPIIYKFRNNEFIPWLQSLENYDLDVVKVDHKNRNDIPYDFAPQYTFLPFSVDTWHSCPFNSEQEALDFLYALNNCNPQFIKTPVSWGEGKTPDLEAARSCAIWPDATIEQLQDKAQLEARLPALMLEFKNAVESLGFTY